MGRPFHANGITVNKTTQTVESGASRSTIGHQDTHNTALLFRYLARGAL
jgi:hypothetical protein